MLPVYDIFMNLKYSFNIDLGIVRQLLNLEYL